MNNRFTSGKANLSTKAVLLFCFWALCLQVRGQENYEIGFSMGPTNFSGDISKPMNLSSTRAGAEVRLGYHFNYEITWRNSVGLMFFAGEDNATQDPVLKARNYSFNATGLYFQSVIEYYFLEFRKDKRTNFSPYLFGGLGAGYHFTNASGGGQSVSPNPTTLSIPFGLGFKQKLSTFWDIGLEFSAQHYFSDNVDGSTDLGSRPFNVGGKVIAKDFNDQLDRSYYLGVTLTYQFYEIKCPKPAFLP